MLLYSWWLERNEVDIFHENWLRGVRAWVLEMSVTALLYFHRGWKRVADATRIAEVSAPSYSDFLFAALSFIFLVSSLFRERFFTISRFKRNYSLYSTRVLCKRSSKNYYIFFKSNIFLATIWSVKNIDRNM